MKRLMTVLIAMAVAIAMSPMASAQGRKGSGRPATTGLEHAEATASMHGQRGIENAEAKQAEHQRELHVIEAPVERASVTTVQKFEDRVAPLFHFATEEVSAEHGRDEEGENQCAKQGEGDGPSHWAKQTAFDTLQREDRKVGNDDDDAGEEDGLLHFVSSGGDDFAESLLVIAEGSVAQDVFHHDDRSVDDHAEIKGS